MRGIVDAPFLSAGDRPLGFTRARVTTPSQAAQTRRQDVILYLKVKDSLTLPAPTPMRVALTGMGLQPRTSACVIDGKVELVNEDVMPVTLSIGKQTLPPLAPGASTVFECSGESGPRRITAQPWDHVRGTLFVGEVGVVAAPGAQGAFALNATTGKYELIVVGESGELGRKDVEVQKVDVDVGRLNLSGQAVAPAPAEGARPEPSKAEPVKTEPARPAPAKAEPAPEGTEGAKAPAPKPATPPAAKKRPQTLDFGADEEGTE